MLALAARRPVAVFMVVTAVFVFGFISYQRLDVALLPKLDYPTLTVRTEFEGAGPRDVDKRVTELLEKRLATTNGLVSMTSVSRSGFSDISLEFGWETDMTSVRADIEAKIAAATLPDEAKRPLVLPYDPNLDPMMRIAVSAKARGERELALARRLAEEELEKELKKLPGVAAAKIRGGREREIAVRVNEAALRRTGISLDTLASKLENANRNEAAGLINEGPIEYVVRSVNELRSAAEIAEIVVARVNDVPIHVRDLATVRETWKEREIAAYLDGKESVLVEIYKKADANLVTVADSVRRRLFAAGITDKTPSTRRNSRGQRRRNRGGSAVASSQSLQQSLGEWVDLKILTDQSRFIEGSIREVRDTALLGGLLAVLVLYLFLRNALYTFIAALVISICVVATFAPMFMAGVSLNIMSLGGLALGVGMLVDNAIVVLESSARKRAEGLGIVESAIEGVRDVAGAISAATLTSVCVFFPIVFVEEAGIAGQIFRDLALTVVFSILVSLLVALFVIPTCLATFPRWRAREESGRVRARFGIAGFLLGDRYVLRWRRFVRKPSVLAFPGLLLGLKLAFLGRMFVLALTALFAMGSLLAALVSVPFRLVLRPAAALWQTAYRGVETIYVPFLRGCLRQRAFVLLAAAGALAYGGHRATKLSPDLIPESRTGEFDVKVSFAPGTPLERTAQRVADVERALRGRPEIEWVATTVGVEADADRAADEGEHTAKLTVRLKREARSERDEQTVRAVLARAIGSVPDSAPAEFLPSSFFRFSVPLRVVLYGAGESEIGRLARAAEQSAVEMRKVPGIERVRSGFGRGAREVRLEFDRVALFRHDLTVEEVTQRVRSKIQGLVPTALVEGSTRTDIRVRLREDDRGTLRDLVALDISAPGRNVLPLAVVLKGQPQVAEGPGEIRRVGGRHAAVITAAYEGLALDQVAAKADAAVGPVADRFGVEYEIAGRSQQAEQSNRALLFALLLAVFLVYAVMAAQFESLWQPLLIMVSLPLAGVGAILLLDWLSLSLSVIVLLGAILLVGIAVNNAIVLVDCMNKRVAAAATRREGIVQAARERLRPILMTTATTILGLLPLTGFLANIPGADVLPLGLGGGDAAELRAPMAITVIGGLFTSTLLTLVVVPVMYDLASGGRRRRRQVEVPA